MTLIISAATNVNSSNKNNNEMSHSDNQSFKDGVQPTPKYQTMDNIQNNCNVMNQPFFFFRNFEEPFNILCTLKYIQI